MSARSRRTRSRRPDLSQHFLRDPVAARLVQSTSITGSDYVVEIGAGRGALTKPLLRRTQHVCAVEIDPYLAQKLSSRFSHLDVRSADFRRLRLPVHPYKVIGNIPFAITTDIVRKLVHAPRTPEDAWLVMQREPAWRLCGRPYGPETLWSLRLKPDWHVEIVDRLRPQDFEPPPRVHSALLWLCRKGRSLLTAQESAVYHALLDTVFGSRPETIARSLRHRASKVQLRRLAADLNFDLADAPSSLAFEQWLGLARFVARRG